MKGKNVFEVSFFSADNVTLLAQRSLILAPIIFYSGQRQSLRQGKLFMVLCWCGYQKDKLLNWAQGRFHRTASHYLHLDHSHLTVIARHGFCNSVDGPVMSVGSLLLDENYVSCA